MGQKILQWSQVFVIGLVLVGVPLAMRAFPIAESPFSFRSYTFGIAQYELFYGFKAELLMLAGVGSAVFLFLKNGFSRERFLKMAPFADPLVWWLGAWIGATTLASFASNHPDVIWYGGLVQRDGLGVQWSYAMLWLVGYQGARSIQFQKIILWCLGISTLLMGVLGWCTVVGISFVDNPWFRNLVIPAGLKDSITITQLGLGGISGFLGNPNDTAFLSAFLVPFWASLLVFSKGYTAPVIFGGLTTIALASALSSAGVAGALGWVVGLVFLSAAAWCHRRKIHPKVIPGIALALWGGAGIVQWKYSQVLTGFRVKPFQILSVIDQVSDSVQQHLGLAKDRDFSTKSAPPEGALFLEGERLYVTHWQPGFIIERLPQGFRLMDLGYRPLLVEGQGLRFQVKDLHFLDIRIEQQEVPANSMAGLDLYRIEKGDQHFVFANTPSGLRVLINQSLIKPIQGRRLGLPVEDNLLSHRIYIWARLMPVIFDRWLLGHGVGGFILDFPNRDVISIAKAFGQGVFVDRPHNIYLQQAYNSGILGLLGFVALLWGALVRSMYSIFWSQPPTSYKFDSLTLAVPLGLLGWALAGCGYDMGVALGGTFWLLIGALGGLSVDTISWTKQ